MTRKQQRDVALGAARSLLRQLGINPGEASAEDAHVVLDDYARCAPEMVASQWYMAATDNDLDAFYRDWRRWQREYASLHSY
ncbi:MAG: hypothetical protein H0U76_27180 [Ktedonobacteraceae bacterium]|nr:hypothetical protein [Ktedonobacteraceae bacterium]